MTNRSKNIGTAAETRVVRFLQGHGFPRAERRALAGMDDKGDILVCHKVIAEVKGGAAAETAPDLKLRQWLVDTERERQNAGAEWAFLVVKRKGHGNVKVGGWWVVELFDLGDGDPLKDGALVRWRLDEYVEYALKPSFAEGNL